MTTTLKTTWAKDGFGVRTRIYQNPLCYTAITPLFDNTEAERLFLGLDPPDLLGKGSWYSGVRSGGMYNLAKDCSNKDLNSDFSQTIRSNKEIVGVKKFIDQKAWPYLQNDLRLRASYLRYDLNTVISAKPKDQKKSLKELTGKLFQDITNLDHAAKVKSAPEAEKYYAIAVSTLNDVLSKIG
ncbi:oxygen-evolving enhancer protein 3-2, chloroplastic-like [Cicer arietinum]|uniref:oxygen-evolving enhancer protein 3-2, chloroplastic-like n=1 Tax=Cicer arietinum TaxID=3827 RepID=UPI003CC6C36D